MLTCSMLGPTHRQAACQVEVLADGISPERDELLHRQRVSLAHGLRSAACSCGGPTAA